MSYPKLGRIAVLGVGLLLSSNAVSKDYSKVCEVPVAYSPLASWDFTEGERLDTANSFIEWAGNNREIENVPRTTLSGLKFHYRGKDPDGDSSSELRYTIKKPQSHIFEMFSVYQPENFYHRLSIRITPGLGYNATQWNKGDNVETNWGDTGRVAKAESDYLWLEAPTAIYDRNWGKGKTITNLTNNAYFESIDSKFMASNNKLSAMWQGQYSNAALIVGTTAIPDNKGGQEGVGFCEFLGSKTAKRSAYKIKSNSVGPEYVECFDPVDNGTKVDFVIERKRSSSSDSPNGIYSIWKRTNISGWQLIFRNESVPAYQAENNHFDSGYIFGWSNSGYTEDTSFYLLNWSIWDKKPYFLPATPTSWK